MRKATGQHAAQFFTDAAVSGRYPCALGYPAVWDILARAKAFN